MLSTLKYPGVKGCWLVLPQIKYILTFFSLFFFFVFSKKNLGERGWGGEGEKGQGLVPRGTGRIGLQRSMGSGVQASCSFEA